MSNPPPGESGLAHEFDRVPATQTTPSARSWLLTVLGTFVLPNGGSAWTTTLIDTLALVGVENATARQALSRAAQSGWLTSEKHGRHARWTLTDHADQLLTSGAERIYSFGLHPASWDGRWLLLFASVPESRRDARYRLRTALNWAGFGSLGAGLWLSPTVDSESEAVAALAAFDEPIPARTFIARHGQIGDEATIVAEAWDLESLEGAYRAFLDDVDVPGGLTGAAAARALIDATHRWRQFPAMDPALPAQLLPADWPGPAAARQFGALRAQLAPEAGGWWKSLDRS